MAIGKTPTQHTALVPTIKIGAVVAQTGVHAAGGRATREGYAFWANWVNAHGGIPIGKQRVRVELIERDDESNPSFTTQLTERLIDEDQVAFLLGPATSAETMAAAAVAERKGVPLVTGTGPAEMTFEQGYRQLFGVMTPARATFDGLLSYVHRQHPHLHTIAVVAANDSASLEAQQGALQRAYDLGLHVVASDRYPRGASADLAPRLAFLKPAIILNASHLSDALTFRRALADAHLNPPIFSQAFAAELPAYAASLGRLANNTLSPSQWSDKITIQGQGTFFPASAAAYAQAFAHFAHHQANSTNASASAAALALELALVHAGSSNPTRVQHALRTLHAATFYGNLSFDARGLNSNKPMYIHQLEHGRLNTLSPARQRR